MEKNLHSGHRQRMKQDFLRTLKKSRKIELSYLRQGMIQEIFDAVLQIIAPLV